MHNLIIIHHDISGNRYERSFDIHHFLCLFVLCVAFVFVDFIFSLIICVRIFRKMDQWVTDKFYSHFPSYSGEKSRRKVLDKDRHDEYNLYLSGLASTDSAIRRQCAKNTQVREERAEQPSISNRQNERQMRRNSNEISERDSSLWNENMDLPGIFNEEMINLRNRRVAEVRQWNDFTAKKEYIKLGSVNILRNDITKIYNINAN